MEKKLLKEREIFQSTCILDVWRKHGQVLYVKSVKHVFAFKSLYD